MTDYCQINKEPIEDQDLVGALFFPKLENPNRLPVIINLNGGSGGSNTFRSELLASQGFAALSLAYFSCETLPPHLQEIPLEYFEKAISWLESHPLIDTDRIGLCGVSRGAELSLILGCLFPSKFKAIVAYVPSSVIYGALIDPNKPAWTYQGKPIAPSAPFPFTARDLQTHLNRDLPISLTPFFLEGMKNEQSFTDAVIPVEKIEAPLLLISGEDDKMWPSTLFASQIEQRLKMKKPSLSCVHYSYPRAGHSITPCLNRTNVGKVHAVDGFSFDFGGSFEEDAKASSDAWAKTLSFFTDHLHFKR